MVLSRLAVQDSELERLDGERLPNHLAKFACDTDPTTSSAWGHLSHVLSYWGLQVQWLGCPSLGVLKQAYAEPLFAARLWVRDGTKAMQVVRGALADGQPLDMGALSVAALHASQVPMDEDVSPDVFFNRQWFARVMRSHGYERVEGLWWAFRLPLSHNREAGP